MTDLAELKALIEKRASTWGESDALLKRNTDKEWSTEDNETWSRFEADLKRLDREIDHLERKRKLDAIDADHETKREEEKGTPEDRYKESFAKYLRDGLGGLNREETETLRGGHVSFDSRAQSTSTTAGGYTIPEGFWNRVQETLVAYSNIASVVNVINTDSGNNLPWPTNDDQSEGAIIGENTLIGEQDFTFGTRNLGAYMYTSKAVRTSFQLLQDSAIDVEGFLAKKLGQRLARIYNRHWTLGTGSGQPDGIAVSPTTGITAASATAVTHDELIDLQHSVDPAYRGAPSVSWMFNDLTLGALRKLTDGDGNKVWAPSLSAGVPSTLLGRPYHINQHMPAMTTGNVPILFGDFNSGYVVRQVRNVQLVRLDELYAQYLQVGWFAFGRMDATKDDTAAYKALEML